LGGLVLPLPHGSIAERATPIEGQAAHDSVEPGAEGRLAPKAWERVPGPHEGILGDFFRVVG
jgi:hypothetical protein